MQCSRFGEAFINEHSLPRMRIREIEGGTNFAFSRRLFVARAFSSLSLSLSVPLFFIPTAWTCHCLSRMIEYLRPAVVLSPLRVGRGTCLRACENTPPVGRREIRGREGWLSSSFRRFCLPFRPAPSSGTCRHATMLAPVIGAPPSRCLLDPKPRILLPGFAPGAISACPPASDTNRSHIQGVQKTEYDLVLKK